VQEFFWDPNGSSLNIIVSIRTRTGLHRVHLSQFNPYILTANAGEPLKSWSPPKEITLLTNKDTHIDMFVVHKDDEPDHKYHAFIKNEKSKVIEHWKALLVEGPYEWVGVAGNWGRFEGPAVSRMPDGRWIL
jgi:hypothetical protein